jgi:hypothetical protein
MKKPMTTIHDLATNEYIEREMSDLEFADWKATVAIMDQEKAEIETKAIAKAELLERLGITADEAELLLA